MTPVPKASSYGADPFDTAMEKDISLNPAVEKGVVDVPSSGSLPAIQKMKSICAPRGLGYPKWSLTDSRTHLSGNRGGRTIPHHMPQLLGADATCDAFPGVNEREVSTVEMQSHELKNGFGFREQRKWFLRC